MLGTRACLCMKNSLAWDRCTTATFVRCPQSTHKIKTTNKAKAKKLRKTILLNNLKTLSMTSHKSTSTTLLFFALLVFAGNFATGHKFQDLVLTPDEVETMQSRDTGADPGLQPLGVVDEEEDEDVDDEDFDRAEKEEEELEELEALVNDFDDDTDDSDEEADHGETRHLRRRKNRRSPMVLVCRPCKLYRFNDGYYRPRKYCAKCRRGRGGRKHCAAYGYYYC